MSVVVAAGACNPGTTRPLFLPHPTALAGTVAAPRPRVVPEVAAWLEARGVPIALQSVRDGYLETGWHRPSIADSVPTGALPVKLRVWVDPDVPGSSRLVVEAVYRPLADPSRPARELEQPVPDAHPAAELPSRLLEAMRERFGTPSGGN